MIECHCGKCERLNSKLNKLLNELKERMYFECAGCENYLEHTLDEKQGIFFYESKPYDDRPPIKRECGLSWVRDLVERFDNGICKSSTRDS